MRASLLLAASIVASMPQVPVPLSMKAPQLLIQNLDCTAAERQAKALAANLGFRQTRMTCFRGITTVALDGRTEAHSVTPSGLITYSLFSPLPKSEPEVRSLFEVPSDVPFVAASGDIVAYMKLDALVLLVPTDKMLKVAFALEEAGFSKSDMTSPPGNNQLLVIRVRLISPSRILQIARIIAAQDGSRPPYAASIGFIRDCDGTIASLGGLALEEARRRADAMARAAQSELENTIGVVDPGGEVTDAVCGFGADATTDQLAAAAQNAHLPGPGNSHLLYATVLRSIRVAWRLKGPPNGPGLPWGSLDPPRDIKNFGFIADGVRASGEALLNNVQPNRVSILIPDWSYDPLVRSQYSKYISYVDFGTGRLLPSITIAGRNAEELQKSLAGFQRYVSALARHPGESAALSFRYSQTNCGPALDAAVFEATQDAVKKAHGKPIRFLQQASAFPFGSSVSCLYESTPLDDWSSNPAPRAGASIAGVVAAY